MMHGFKRLDAATLIDWTQRFVRHPSEQTELMESDPAVQALALRCVAPIVERYGLRWRRDALGNFIVEAGSSAAPLEFALFAYAMTHPRGAMRDPFAAELVTGPQGDTIRGRGVSEQKAGMAASLAAFLDMAATESIARRCCWILLTAGETGRHDAMAAALAALDARPRFAIMAIGTDGRIGCGHRGRLDIELEITGQVGHSSTPWLGIDATVGVRQALEQVQQLGALCGRHEELGPASFTCTSIRTEPLATHTVQSRAQLVFDRRLLPFEDVDESFERIEARLVSHIAPARAFVRRGPYMHGYVLDEQSELLSHVRAALISSGFEWPNTYYSVGALDGGYLYRLGTEAVMWGPGDPAQFHTDEEWVSIAALTSSAAHYRAVLRHCVGASAT